ncbi:centrosomal protein of 295 kDa isoform X2 [Elgaria multicarinata webbii]|uniref:centrosomal protein of 295 kDa isoform X2 n=1 Tax=Elgaria multicarinata webbii TaxID=159646 RepID=UPI002FCCCA87
MYPKMKRKVTKAGGLRLSPNEEAQLLKEEYERRRKLRLQQVREQERNIALQIRQDVKQRRDEHLHQLAEELKAEWRKAQDEKIKALEKLYWSSLRTIGEGHRQAKENEPDLEALAKQAEKRKQRAEKRHKEALKEQKNQKEKLLREQTRRANARKHAFDVEKERAAKIASLPPPPPHPFENIELKTVPTVKVCDVDTFSVTRHHHFDPYLDREIDTEQPDARLLAEEEAKRKEELQKEEERERREQAEKARLRGKHALKKVLLARDREKLMKELEQMQNMDLARRRQIVAQMPPQLFEPAYRRVELKEEWQRELECAFEDMYTGDRKMKGDLILHLDPQPLPTFSDQSQDDELELSQEPGSVSEVPPRLGDEVKDSELGGSEVEKAPQPQPKLALKKLLNKIRNQKDQWTSKCEPEVPSEFGTIESGIISSGERRLCESEPEYETQSGPVPEAKEFPEILDLTVVAGNAVLNPQEGATKMRMEAERQNQIEWLERQKQQQLALLQQIEEQKIRLEVDLLKAQIQHQEQEVKREQEKKDQESQTEQMNVVPVVHHHQTVEPKSDTPIGTQAASSSKEDDHVQMIREYQQHLLMQNRMHRDSVEEARKHLLEYQNKLKQRYQSVSTALLGPAERHVHLHSIPEPSLQLQRFDMLQRLNQPSKKAPVQEPAEYSKLPLEQKNKERRPDVDSGEQAQSVGTQVNQRPFQLKQNSCSHPEKEKLSAAGTSATPSLEFYKIPGPPTLKPRDTSVTTQPVTHTQHVQFAFPADNSTEPSQTICSDKLVPHTPLVEQSLLPTPLKHQHVPTESRLRTTDPLQSVFSLPSPVASEAGRTQEPFPLKNRSGSFSGCSDIVELRDRMLASSENIQAQQEHLKELQEQLDEQREALLSRQRIQEDLLMQKHAQLKRQMEQQQEALKEFLKQAGQSSTRREMPQVQETNSLSLLALLSEEAKDGSREEVHAGDVNVRTENKVLFQNVGSAEHIEPFQNTWGREQKWRLSKPPLAKVKLGLDLEQHELSIIPELDTPRSGRLSTTGYRESFTGEVFLPSSVDKWQSSKSPNESLHEETDILRITADGEEHSSSENQDQLHGSWHDSKLGGFRDSVHYRELILTDQGLPSYAADIGNRVATYPDPSFKPNSTVALPAAWPPGSLSPQTDSKQVACGYFSSSALSAVRFISNDSPDRNLASTEPSSTKHFSSPMKENANASWDPSVSLLHNQDDTAETPDSHLSFGETVHLNGSKIQQIIDKYTRDFSWSSLSNISSHDPAVGLDVAEIERTFPNFHRELFQPLEPSPDFDSCSHLSLCRVSYNSKDLSKSLDLSESHESTASSLEERSNLLSFLSTGKLSNILPTEQAGEEIKEQLQGAEEFFEHLPVESALSKLRQGVDKPGAFSSLSEQNFEISSSIEKCTYISPGSAQCEELEGDENVSLYSSVENFRSLTPVDDHGSLYQLIPDDGTMKNAVGRTEDMKEDMWSREENLCFVELPTASTNREHDMLTENAIMHGDVEIDLSQCTLHTVGEESSLRSEIMWSLPHKINSKISINPEQNYVQQSVCELDKDQQSNPNATQAKSSVSCLSQSNRPVWEALTGRGIMEEPELTLISSNDISTAESDLELLNQADGGKEKSENLSYIDNSEVKSCPKSRGFLPLNPEVDDSISTQLDYPCIDQSLKEKWNKKTKPAAVSPELTSVPGSLQESFLKRKKDFIERSSKRLERLKSKERSSEKLQAKTSQQKKTQLHKPKENLLPPGAAVSHLKKLEEIKVCSAEDRKSVEIQMHQRTSRLYNNLPEVKNRKEERERQENYAKNREKAKEFQKKTLEKLRARKVNIKKAC